MTIDPRLTDAFARLPDYLGSHVLVSVTALALGLGISLPLAIVSRQRPVLRAGLLTVASVVQTIPGLALLALFYPMLLALSGLCERLFGKGFSALGFLPSVLALALYSMLPVLRNTVVGARRHRRRHARRGARAGAEAAANFVARRVAARHAGDHGRHPHRGGMGDRHRHAVDADRADQPRQLHLRRLADAELGVRAVRLRRRRGAGARRRSASRPDGARRQSAQPARMVVGGGVGLVLVVLAALLPGYGRAQATYVIGAKPFTEQYVLAALIEQRLKAQGLSARQRAGLGSGVIFNALAAGDIDAYVDYSGTIWANEMHRSDVKPRAEVLADVSRWLATTHDIRLLGPLGFENAYALAMPRARAEKLGIRSIADLAAHAGELSIAGDYEFFERPEWKAIRDAYGLHFRVQRTMQSDFMYQAAKAGDVDVVSAYTSDGRIAQYDLDGARRSQARHPALRRDPAAVSKARQ